MDAAAEASSLLSEKYARLFVEEGRNGEAKLCTLRLIALGAYYLNHLVNVHILQVVEPDLQWKINAALLVWAAWAVPLWWAVCRRKLYHGSFKYVAPLADTLGVTYILLAGDGPSGPIVPVYYLLAASASLRYSRKATVATSLYCATAYLALQLHALKTRPELAVATHHAATHIVSFVMVGLLAGYVVHQLRTLVIRFIEDVLRREKAEGALSRYVSRQVAQQILQGAETLQGMLTGRRRQVTILLSDIRGFTPLAERLDPEKLFALLNRYFGAMIDVIFRHDGTLDKFVGDAILVVFGDPLEQPDPEARALRCAKEMHGALDRFNEEQSRARQPKLEMGISIHSGPVAAGNVGSESRMEYTVLGDTVNLTQRLQSKTAAGKVLVSEAVYAKLKSQFKFRALSPFPVKGYTEPVTAYEWVS